jgi:hypothetical protein
MDTILLNGIVQLGERIAIVEDAGAGAEDPRAAAVGLPGDAEARGEIVRWGGERGRATRGNCEASGGEAV